MNSPDQTLPPDAAPEEPKPAVAPKPHGQPHKPKRRPFPRHEHSRDPHLHKGTIQEIRDGSVYVNLGASLQGVIDLTDFETPPNVGDTHEFMLENLEGDHWRLSRQEARILETWNHLTMGATVNARVIGENSRGLEMKVGPVSAFLPANQIDLGHVNDFTEYFGKSFDCRVIEVNRRKKRVVLSRKELLLEERAKHRSEFVSKLESGQIMSGKVEKLEPYGAFIALGEGVSGLLHVSNISHHRIHHPSEVLQMGQEVTVQVLEIKTGRKIGLGMKQLIPDPWKTIEERLRTDRVLTGKVSRTTEFGAFVVIEPGIEGLCHISQLSTDRVGRVDDAVKAGEEIRVRVLSVDCERHRISLSRLNSGGELLGPDEVDDAAAESHQTVYKPGKIPVSGTNLGEVLRRALEKK